VSAVEDEVRVSDKAEAQGLVLGCSGEPASDKLLYVLGPIQVQFAGTLKECERWLDR
jgi:hypothetical protein